MWNQASLGQQGFIPLFQTHVPSHAFARAAVYLTNRCFITKIRGMSSKVTRRSIGPVMWP